MADDGFTSFIAELERIDVTDDLILMRKTKWRSVESIALISSEVVENVMRNLTTDIRIPSSTQEAIGKISAEDLVSSLLWLNDCLVDRNGQQLTSREKVWSTYHMKLICNINTSGAVDRQILSLIALHTMQHLVQLNFHSSVTAGISEVPPVDDRDREILAYIAGYLLRKLSSHPESSHLTEVAVESSLILAMNRGGLTQPKQAVIDLVIDLEILFRDLPEKSVNRELFWSKLTGDFSAKFYSILESVDTASAPKELFFTDFCNLFFKVRAHHKCRFMLENIIKKTKTKKKTKALRDSL